MARIRSLKPDFTQNDKLSALPAETHLLAAGLICYADDEGYFQANPKLVQAAVFPLRELAGNIPEMLRSLAGIDYIETFSGSDGRAYGKIVHFDTHQRVSHKLISKIKALRETAGNIPEKVMNAPEVLRPELKGNGIEVEVEGEGFPEPQHPLNHARRMAEVLGLSERILRSIEAGLMAEVQLTGNGFEDTAQFITNRAMADRVKGIPIDKFYFDDTKWRNGNGKQSKPSASTERAEQSARNILDGITADARRRTATDSPQLQVRAGGRTSNRI